MKFLDIFAGIGGFRLGLEMAGHKCVGHIEIDKYANKSYIAMHNPKEDEFYGQDIRTIKPGELPEADIYCGGFPCQSFSIAGKQRGFEDTRGTLIFEVLRLVKERKPKILFLENVKGLLNHDNGKTFATILLAISELGYSIEWQVLNSKDFGVPQNRERVFIIGHLGGFSGREILPIRQTNTETIKQIISGSQGYRVYDTNGISITLASQAGGMGARTGLYLVNKNNGEIILRDDVTCLDANYAKGIDNHGARTGVMTLKDANTCISHTIRTGGMGSLTARHSWDIYKINNRIRRLTPKECFRLQGFPDEYFERARKVNSDSQLYKQAGNGVTVNVIYEIAKRIDNANNATKPIKRGLI